MIDQINALLPQTQCQRCGYKGCLPYAQAIAAGKADINQCPPGGDDTIMELAQLLGLQAKPLNTAFGHYRPQQIAFIIEPECIGCAKCIAVCPVDAIVGAAKFLHTVIASECTGCELCIPPCPVDCITMQPRETNPAGSQASLSDKSAQARLAKRRYDARCSRKTAETAEKAQRAKLKKELLTASKRDIG